MMRPVLRRIALKIRLRCQAYLWIYFAGAIAALVVLNVLLWYPLSHRLLAAHLAALFAVLTGLSVVIIFVAAKTTNDITPIHRSRLQRERLAIEREISAGADATRAVTLEHARRLLKTIDENMRSKRSSLGSPRRYWASRRRPGPSAPCCRCYSAGCSSPSRATLEPALRSMGRTGCFTK